MARRDIIKNFPFRISIAEASRKRVILFLITGLFIFSFSSASTFSQTKNSAANALVASWIGKYDFEDVGKRRSQIELIPSVYYVLELSKNKRTADTNCSFTASGFQTNEEHQCSVKATGDKLSVYFEKDLVHTSNEDKEFVRFRRGQLLFSLSKSQAIKTARYQFQSADYDIPLFSGKKKAIYFTKTK